MQDRLRERRVNSTSEAMNQGYDPATDVKGGCDVLKGFVLHTQAPRGARHRAASDGQRSLDLLDGSWYGDTMLSGWRGLHPLRVLLMTPLLPLQVQSLPSIMVVRRAKRVPASLLHVVSVGVPHSRAMTGRRNGDM